MNQNQTVENLKIDEAELDDVPSFYVNLTNDPVATVVEGKSVYNGIFRLVKYIDLEASVGPRQIVGGFFIVPGETTLTGTHGIKEGAVFGIAYTPAPSSFIGLRPVKVSGVNYSVEIGNFDTVTRETSFRIYFYQILRKERQ